MGKRVQQRLKAVLPIRVSGQTVQGKAFDESTYTLDISRAGARLVLPGMVAPDQILTIMYKQRKANFRVKWVARRNDHETLIGVVSTDPHVVLWTEIRKEESGRYSDEFSQEEQERSHAVQHAATLLKSAQLKPEPVPAPMPAPVAAPAHESWPAELEAMEDSEAAEDSSEEIKLSLPDQINELTASVAALEPELLSDDLNPALLQELRDALSRASEVAWIALQRAQLKNSGATSQSSLPLISMVNNDRLSTATRLCTEFMRDFSSADLALEEKTVNEFRAIAEQLVFELALAVCQ